MAGSEKILARSKTKDRKQIFLVEAGGGVFHDGYYLVYMRGEHESGKRFRKQLHRKMDIYAARQAYKEAVKEHIGK